MLLIKLIQAYSVILVIYALLSWFPGAYESTLGKWIIKLVEPYLRLFDRLNLHIGSLGFSVFAGVIVLNIIARLLTSLLNGVLY